MPLYEYVCDACGQRFEIIQKFSDGPPEACPACGKGPVVRQMSSPAIQFKGTGWYITDYAQKGKSGESSSSSSKSDSGKSDSKSDAAEKSTDTAAKSESTTKTETTKSPPQS